MGLITGSVSVTRFNVAVEPPEADFDQVAFREIAPGSEVRESVGFVPYEPGGPYEAGTRRHAFRVRIDKLRPDPTRVRERLKELVKAEQEMSGARFIGPKKRRQLRGLAEEELIVEQAPRSTVIECALDGDLLYVGSTAKSYLGTVILLLRRIGYEVSYRTPWLERGQPELYSEIVETKDQSESVYGCRFIKQLVGDQDFMIEPEEGQVRLATRDARIALTGAVLPELHRYLEKGAEILSAKLVSGETRFKLDGPSFRISALRLPSIRGEHWTEELDERLLQLSDLYEQLEAKYDALMLG